MISENLLNLRRAHSMTQEQVASQLGISRQAVAKWENGETTPDIVNCLALAKLYDVSLDDLVNYRAEHAGLPLPSKGKHLFGTVTVGDKGQIVIPKRAREIFQIAPGDQLVMLGDEAQGLALAKADDLLKMMEMMRRGEAES